MVRKNKTLPLLSYITNEYRSDETQFVEETIEHIFFKGCTKLWKCFFTILLLCVLNATHIALTSARQTKLINHLITTLFLGQKIVEKPRTRIQFRC